MAQSMSHFPAESGAGNGTTALEASARLPDNFTIHSVAISQGAVLVNTGGEVGVALGPMNAGGSAFVTIIGAPVDSNPIFNSAVVNAGANDSDPNSGGSMTASLPARHSVWLQPN